MIKKLFVDDIRQPPDDTWTLARTVTEAIRYIDLYGVSIEEISLDHDISLEVRVGNTYRPFPSEETYQPVARFITRYYEKLYSLSPKITLHTANPVGAEEMKKILSDFSVEIKLSEPAYRTK